ncbi:RING-type E3 ubiquitin transferase [Ranunculus cassubicifolius]
MTIRFKFRSSVNFDSIDINGRPSISVRDLRSKIVEQKNLKICHDFDLVISDAITGKEFEDENFAVPSGSSVIIKRVPAGRSATPAAIPLTDVVENVGVKQKNMAPTINPCLQEANPVNLPPNKSSHPASVELENFDDFGIDFYPAIGDALLDSDPDVDKTNCISTGRIDNVVPRSSETSIARGQNLEPSGLSDAVQKGSTQCNLQIVTLQTVLKSKVDEQKISNNGVDACSPAIPKSDLPSELRCPLCNTIFKEAMMIPCCQHSFCAKCIRLVLIEKARCPKCSSAKCRVDDLLPNLSLRQAIEHFLESQMLISGSENIHPQYVPDGESGIRGNDVSGAISVRQREQRMPHSPSATGKGSNQVMPEELKTRNKASSARVFDMNAAGVESFAVGAKHRKGERACYMCGSPDHYIKDCPTAAAQYPMHPTGDAMYPGGMPAYGPSYWQGSSFPQASPYGNLYATPGMMPFTPAMVPVTPFQVPSYMPSMYGGMSVPCGYMRTGGVVHPMAARAERPVSEEELMELRDIERRHRNFSDHPKRGKLYDSDPDVGYHCPQLSNDRTHYMERDNSASYSENSDPQRSRKRHSQYKHIDEDGRRDKGSRSSTSGRDRRAYGHDVSSSGAHEVSGSQQSKERHKHHHRSSRKHSEKRVDTEDNSTQRGHYQYKKQASTDRKRVESDIKIHNHRHHSKSDSGLESEDRKRHRKEKDSLKHSRHKVKPRHDEPSHERWEMIEGLDADNIDDYYQHHKRKRRH